MNNTWSCVVSDSSTTLCTVLSSSTASVSLDSSSTQALYGELGTLQFGVALLIFFATMIFAGLLWNAIKSK